MARRAEGSERFLEWPSDRSLDQLQRLFLRLVLMASGRQDLQFAWFWPDGHPWATILTHDVETAGGLARIPHVAQMERQRGLRSSFNLVPLDYEVPGSLLDSLREDGFEIGVHGYTHDGLLFSKWSTFLERVPTINECGRQWNASGFRSPATYRNQEWFHLLGFEYDSSMTDTAPYEPQPGGCASLFPFPIDHLVELPMTLPQDHTLFGLLGQTDSDTWLTKLRQIKDANGMACVLTHPDPVRGYIGLAENEAHYIGLLDAVADSEAWTPLPRDLARWWRARMLVRSAEAGAAEGVSYGRAVLDPSGRLEILPPSR
jgi:peptidoglycan/xylan/chitin deacetylase (PgdA/CDA1 family)